MPRRRARQRIPEPQTVAAVRGLLWLAAVALAAVATVKCFRLIHLRHDTVIDVLMVNNSIPGANPSTVSPFADGTGLRPMLIAYLIAMLAYTLCWIAFVVAAVKLGRGRPTARGLTVVVSVAAIMLVTLPGLRDQDWAIPISNADRWDASVMRYASRSVPDWFHGSETAVQGLAGAVGLAAIVLLCLPVSSGYFDRLLPGARVAEPSEAGRY